MVFKNVGDVVGYYDSGYCRENKNGQEISRRAHRVCHESIGRVVKTPEGYFNKEYGTEF